MRPTGCLILDEGHASDTSVGLLTFSSLSRMMAWGGEGDGRRSCPCSGGIGLFRGQIASSESALILCRVHSITVLMYESLSWPDFQGGHDSMKLLPRITDGARADNKARGMTVFINTSIVRSPKNILHNSHRHTSITRTRVCSRFATYRSTCTCQHDHHPTQHGEQCAISTLYTHRKPV